jgi:hypothetical protein
VVGPPVAPPGSTISETNPKLRLTYPQLRTNVLARLRDAVADLCVPLRSVRLGFVSGRFHIVLRLLEMRLGHRGVLLEGGLGFPSGCFEVVLGLREMRVVVGRGLLALVLQLV